jgi:hypothetical protein
VFEDKALADEAVAAVEKVVHHHGGEGERTSFEANKRGVTEIKENVV